MKKGRAEALEVVLKRSRRYVERYYAEENEKLLKLARADFEKLRDIPNMPDEALDILRGWTTREEDMSWKVTDENRI